MLNFPGLCDITLQCGPEPSLMNSAECVKSERSERSIIRSSPRRIRATEESETTTNNCKESAHKTDQTLTGSIVARADRIDENWNLEKGWKGICKSRTEAGRQMEIWCVAGQKRPHRRAPAICYLGQCYLGQMLLRPMLLRPMLLRPMLLRPMPLRPMLLRPIVS